MLLYWMAQHYEQVANWRIFLDSPMAIRATRVYARHVGLFDKKAVEWLRGKRLDSLLPNLTFTRTANQSIALNDLHTGAIIIAGSGMCTGGRITHHLQRNLWRPECHVVIVGYQAHGTPGRALVEGAKQIRLFGKYVNVAAKIHTVGGLSAHAGQAALMRWYDQFHGRPPLLLVHGEPEAQATLRDLLEAEFAAPVHIATVGERLDLNRPIPWDKPR
jgi:metallo-beta-lactamase family protein